MVGGSREGDGVRGGGNIKEEVEEEDYHKGGKGAMSPAYQVFENILYRWAKVFEDAFR